jgi:hypothetical protein
MHRIVVCTARQASDRSKRNPDIQSIPDFQLIIDELRR